MRERLTFLDGLRGWGAVTVVLYHYYFNGFPPIATLADGNVWWRLMVLNGNFAVDVFFIVSGFSLSIAYLQRPDWRIPVGLAAGRYVRLAIPIFAICFIVFVMMRVGLIAPSNERQLLRDFLEFEPDLWHAVSFGLFDVFFRHTLERSFAPPLWTMRFELFGSFLVLALLMVQNGTVRMVLYVVITAALLLAGSYYALFVFGALLAAIYAARPTRRLHPGVIAVLAVGIAAMHALPSEHARMAFFGAAIGFTTLVAFHAPMRAFFETRTSAFLGRISFSLYLVHAPLMYSLTLWLLLVLQDLGTFWSRMVACSITLVAAFAAAIAFNPINTFSIKAARWVGAACVAAIERSPRPGMAARPPHTSR